MWIAPAALELPSDLPSLMPAFTCTSVGFPPQLTTRLPRTSKTKFSLCLVKGNVKKDNNEADIMPETGSWGKQTWKTSPSKGFLCISTWESNTDTRGSSSMQVSGAHHSSRRPTRIFWDSLLACFLVTKLKSKNECFQSSPTTGSIR